MNRIKPYLLYIAWAAALLATLGSLYFQYAMHLPPCVLCWYQRIFMYPFVIILGVGILIKDVRVALYAIPLAIIGTLIAIYHNLLYYKIIPESAGPCVQGISCTTKFFEWLGFITIPFLSLISFFIVLVSLIIYYKTYVKRS